MRKKITFLIGCVAMMLLGSGGNALGQTYWDNGCGSTNTCTWSVGNTSYHDGLNIDGNRREDYFTITTGTVPHSNGHYYVDILNINPSGGSCLVWRNNVLQKASWSWTTVWSSWVLVNLYKHTFHVTYSDVSYPSGVCGFSGVINSSDNYHTSSWICKGPITVNVNADAACGSVYYKWFHWGSPTWTSYHWTCSPTGTWSSSVSGPNVLNPNQGSFILKNGVNVRIENAAQFDATNTNILTRIVNFLGNYTLRFDKAFAGTTGATSVTGTQSADLASNIGTGNTIGLWKGTSKPLTFVNGGTLLLGPNSDAQSNINLVNATGGNIDVNNYICCNGSTLFNGDALWKQHGIYFNVTGTITNDPTSTISIVNPCDETCGTNVSTLPITTGNTEAKSWLALDGKIPDLWKGNVLASASGTVNFPAVESITAAAGTHEVESRDNALIWSNNYDVTDNGTATENYHTNGDCCESYILANGTQKYTFADDGSSLAMTTTTGKIQMDQTFDFLASGANNSLDMSGQSYVLITGAANIETANEGNATITSPAGFVRFGDALTYTQSGTPTTTNGLLLWGQGACDATNCNYTSGTGGYVLINGAAATTNVGTGTTTIKSDNHYVQMNSTYTHTGEDGNLLIEATGQCQTDCDNYLNNTTGSGLDINTGVGFEEGFLPRPNTYTGGGYVWLRDAVAITMAATSEPEANATIHSGSDIIQFDKTFDFTDTKGSNLLVYGDKGVRTIGAATTTNTLYDATNLQGNVRYESPNGFIDFWNTYTHTATTGQSKLEILGNHRVEFNDVATFNMGSATGDNGADSIISEHGWIDAQKTFNFTGTDGDLLVWANGNGAAVGLRSCLDSTHNCDNRGGFVHFNDETTIDYAINSGTGTTWIRSFNDDVKIDQNFTYSSPIPTDTCGLFVMQAGQDIYGISDGGYGEDPETTNAHGTTITFTQPGNRGILMQAKKTVHLVQDLVYDRTSAESGNITISAGYTAFTDTANVDNIDPYGNETADWTEGACTPDDYTSRFGCQSTEGGDIWFEGDVPLNTFATDNTINTTFRAWNSIFIDQNLIYEQTTKSGNAFLFAQTGNIEAIDGSVTTTAPTTTPINSQPTSSVTGTAVNFTISDATNDSEIRLQAGNQADNTRNSNSYADGICETNESCLDDWEGSKGEYDGNILFNKPLTIEHAGLGFTMLSASRDIENQVNAPFIFDYTSTSTTDTLIMTAGRHIETHNSLTFNYPETTVGDSNGDQIVMQAGRLGSPQNNCNASLCKANEVGSSLTELTDNTTAYDPASVSLDGSGTTTIDNEFSKGGDGQGSILMFDSVTFNYNGKGRILMTALNGNIESDPYLHRVADGNAGYDGAGNIHDAQLTFNHGGTGITRMEAIDIKLHDKLAYYAFQAASDSNGQFYMAAYDSILTRNLQYVNPTDTGSVFITTAKYKAGCGTSGYNCSGDPGAIQQGHIVLGYGADCTTADDLLNKNDSIIFNFAGNTHTEGANVYILAGYEGFDHNGNTYGGNITFDYMNVEMADGNHKAGGYMEISTPNGNIWGKDSINYHALNGDLLIDAGIGSVDATSAIRWEGFSCPGGSEKTLNTDVLTTCGENSSWRTGDIMMKGGTLNFKDGTGNATFRTREGFIDTYDAFTVDSMAGHLLKYASAENSTVAAANQWGDVSERDFKYNPVEHSGSVFFGADDNIMMNYGYNNDTQDGKFYNGRGNYDIAAAGLEGTPNPYYSTSYMNSIDACRSIFNVNEDGYMWYRHNMFSRRKMHGLYRGCASDSQQTGTCSATTGECKTINNFARDLDFNFDTDANGENIVSGGLATVATNYIDMFTKFNYYGGQGSGLASVPNMTTLHGEAVQGYGLYMKSQFTGSAVEHRRATCEGCGEKSAFPMEGNSSESTYEWTYLGFHDDARIHVNDQKALLEAPVVEFFGHAELDTWTASTGKSAPGTGNIKIKTDSLIFHDSVIFDYSSIGLEPFTTGTQRTSDMRYGVINDGGKTAKYYVEYGPAISMTDRNLPVLELGYQRCNEPKSHGWDAPNLRSNGGLESTPFVGGDVIVSTQHGYSLPIFNTVVANHARISFVDDMLDGIGDGGEYVESCVRTDLLRIRNNVEFYEGNNEYGLLGNRPEYRRGTLKMTSPVAIEKVVESGIYPTHLHMEPGSELSLPGENTLIVEGETTIGGFGNIHENVAVKAFGTIAPGYASLMEGDCQTPYKQGKLTTHNLKIEKDGIFRISIGRNNCDKEGNNCTQTDTLVVQDTVNFRDKIYLEVLPQSETIDPGCYLFMVYGDSTGVSKEYVKNLKLKIDRYNDFYFGLNFSESGKVYLCVSTFPQPEVQRYVDLPSVEGITTNPNAGKHYVAGHQDFSFTATYSGTPLKAWAKGYYTNAIVDLDSKAVKQDDGSYLYTLYQITEPWIVTFGPETSSATGNSEIEGQSVWAYNNTLHINVNKADIVSVYTMTGVLYKRMDIPEGLSKLTLERGMYVVTLKDGSVYKIVIK